MKKKKDMTYSFYVSIAGKEAENLEKMSEESRQALYVKLGSQFIEKGLLGKRISE